MDAAVDLHALGDSLDPPPGPQQVESLGEAGEVVDHSGWHDVDVDGFHRHAVEGYLASIGLYQAEDALDQRCFA